MVTKAKRETYQAFAARLLRACSESPDLPEKKERGFLRELGKLAGIGYKGAEKWTKGDSMPDIPNGVMLAHGLGVNFEWLMTGRGPMRGDTKHGAYHVSEPTTTYSIGFSKPAQRVARAFDDLKDDQKKAILVILDGLKK